MDRYSFNAASSADSTGSSSYSTASASALASYTGSAGSYSSNTTVEPKSDVVKTKGTCKVLASNLEFIVGISIDEAEDTKSITYQFDQFDYILFAYNEKYKFTMQAKIHANNKKPMDDLLDELRTTVSKDRFVAQLDKQAGVLNIATIIRYENNKPIKYQSTLLESTYNKHPIRDILRQVDADERRMNYMWHNYVRNAY